MANKKKTKLAEPCKDILNSLVAATKHVMTSMSCYNRL
jgi:hypothetical protein